MTTIQTLHSLSKHFNPEIQSKYSTIVGLANISSPSGNMPDDVISIILGYAGDIDVKRKEMDILYNCIKRIRWISNYTYNRNDGTVYKHSSNRTMLYCYPCNKIFTTNSYKIAFNHCLSKCHKRRARKFRYPPMSSFDRNCLESNILSRNGGSNTVITNFRIENEIYPDSWKLYIREKKIKEKLKKNKSKKST